MFEKDMKQTQKEFPCVSRRKHNVIAEVEFGGNTKPVHVLPSPICDDVH